MIRLAVKAGNSKAAVAHRGVLAPHEPSDCFISLLKRHIPVHARPKAASSRQGCEHRQIPSLGEGGPAKRDGAVRMKRAAVRWPLRGLPITSPSRARGARRPSLQGGFGHHHQYPFLGGKVSERDQALVRAVAPSESRWHVSSVTASLHVEQTSLLCIARPQSV